MEVMNIFHTVKQGYGKAIFTINDNLVEDCTIPFLIDYEPDAKISLAPNSFRYITMLNNKTKFNGILFVNLKSEAGITAYDNVDFDGNNFVFGKFTRKPQTFLSTEQPLYFVKGDVLLTIDNNTLERKVTVTNGFNPTPAQDRFYFISTAGIDYENVH